MQEQYDCLLQIEKLISHRTQISSEVNNPIVETPWLMAATVKCMMQMTN